METIRQAIQAATDKIVADGTIEKTVEKCVTEAVKQGVERALQTYGDFGKSVEEAVKTAVQFDVKELGLPAYNQIIINLVRQKVEALVHVQGAKQIAKDLDEMIGGIAPAEIKLSELVQEFRKKNRDEYDNPVGTVFVESDDVGLSTYWHIFLDEQQRDRGERHRCEYQIDISSEGKIYNLKLPYERKISKHDPVQQPLIGKYHGFARLLYQAYAVGSKIVIDETDFPNDYD